MSGYQPGEALIRRAIPAAEGLVDVVRRRDAAGIDRLLTCRRRTEREWYAFAIALADMVATAETAGVKPCTKCGNPKPFDQFYPHPARAHGIQDWCKTCHLASKRKPPTGTIGA